MCCRIPQAEIDRAFATGGRFLKLPTETKKRWPFNPNRYLGWRGPDELETVTGAAEFRASRGIFPLSIGAIGYAGPTTHFPFRIAGNRLWEWFSVGHFGLGGGSPSQRDRVECFRCVGSPLWCEKKAPPHLYSISSACAGYDVPSQKFIGSEWPPEKELGLEGFKARPSALKVLLEA